MKISVDRELCMGNEECVRAAPAAFVLDDEGIAATTAAAVNVPVEQLREAERRCPVMAITLEEVGA